MEKIGEENYALLLKRLVKQCKESEQTGGFEATVVKDDDFIYAYSVANQRLGLQNLVVGAISAYTPAKMILGLLKDVTSIAVQSGKPLEDRGVFAMQWASNEKVFQCYSMRIHSSQLHLFALGIECEKQLGLPGSSQKEGESSLLQPAAQEPIYLVVRSVAASCLFFRRT